jgi:hypothetical protein
MKRYLGVFAGGAAYSWMSSADEVGSELPADQVPQAALADDAGALPSVKIGGLPHGRPFFVGRCLGFAPRLNG